MGELKLILKHASLVSLTFSFPWKGVFKYLVSFTKTYTQKKLTFTEHIAKLITDFISFNSFHCSEVETVLRSM